MRTGLGKDESRLGSKSSITGAEAGDDRVYPVDGGSTRTVSSIVTKTKNTDDCLTFGGQDGARTTPVETAPWFEPVENDGCKDGVCPVPWLANSLLTEDRNSNFPGTNTIPRRPDLQPDVVNHPSHYTDGEIECIDAIEAQLTAEEYRGYLRGNCAKYLWRCMLKGKPVEDLKKCQWYLERLLQAFKD